MRIAVVEDNLKYTEILRNYLSQYQQDSATELEVTCYPTADALLAEYDFLYVIILMDIELPGTNGMEAAQRIRARDREVIIIFITKMAQYAIEGYKVQAMDYIVKPITYKDFQMKLDRAVSKAGNRMDYDILVPVSGGFQRLSVKELMYVEVLGHSLIYHMDSGNLETRSTMKEAEKALKDCGFLRINNCYLVNPRFVTAVDGLFMNVGRRRDRLRIAKARKRDIMIEWANWLSGEGRSLHV